MRIPENIFYRKLYAKVRLSAMEAETLPAWCYTPPPSRS